MSCDTIHPLSLYDWEFALFHLAPLSTCLCTEKKIHSILCTRLPFLVWFARSVCAADVKRGANWIRSSMALTCVAPLCLRLVVHSQLIRLYSISKRFSCAVTCPRMSGTVVALRLARSLILHQCGSQRLRPSDKWARLQRKMNFNPLHLCHLTKWKAWLPAIAYLKCLIPPLKNLFTWIRDN